MLRFISIPKKIIIVISNNLLFEKYPGRDAVYKNIKILKYDKFNFVSLLKPYRLTDIVYDNEI